MARSSLNLVLALILETSGCGRQAAESAGAQQVRGLQSLTLGRGNAVALVYESSDAPNGMKVFCSGALVWSHTVLTAAHCYRAGPVKVFFGQDIRSSSAARFTRNAFRFVPHPEFRKYVEDVRGKKQVRTENDLAVVQFEGDAPAEAMLTYLQTAVAATPGERVTSWGYGVSDPSDQDAIHSGENPDSLGSRLANEFSFTGQRFAGGCVAQLKAVMNGSYACAGDSGGPAFVRDSLGKTLLVGIASYVNGSNNRDMRCDEGYVYHTLVACHSDWISQQLR